MTKAEKVSLIMTIAKDLLIETIGTGKIVFKADAAADVGEKFKIITQKVSDALKGIELVDG